MSSCVGCPAHTKVPCNHLPNSSRMTIRSSYLQFVSVLVRGQFHDCIEGPILTHRTPHAQPFWQSVTSRLETSRYRDFSQFFESIGLSFENFGLEKKSRYRSR